MGDFNNIMVGLDLSTFDKGIINYTRYFNIIARPEKINFVHIQKDLNIPEEIIEQYPALNENIENTFIQEMVNETEGSNIVGAELQYYIHKGDPFDILFKQANKKSIDLVIVGKKTKQQDVGGVLPQKIARKLNTNVLLIPEGIKPQLKKILVEVDFSDYSKLALEKAIELASNNNAEILCQHVYEVPIGYSKIGKSFEEFADLMKKNAEKRYKKFISEIDTKDIKVQPVFTLNNHDRICQKIKEFAEKENIDLLVIGARGRTNAASLLLGSVAENIVSAINKTPLLLVKKKGDLFDFWEAIKNL